MQKFLFLVCKPKWNRENWPDFVSDGDVPADCVKDLNAKGNKLSIWLFNDDGDEKQRILTALAAAREHLAEVDYLVCDVSSLEELQIPFEKSAGGTPDSQMNAMSHHDVINLTGKRLVTLAVQFSTNGQTDRVTPSKVRGLLARAIAENWVDKSLMKPQLVEKI